MMLSMAFLYARKRYTKVMNIVNPINEKSTKLKFDFFHTSEYHFNVWKNMKFEFGALSKSGTKHFFTFVQNNIYLSPKTSKPIKKHFVMIKQEKKHFKSLFRLFVIHLKTLLLNMKKNLQMRKDGIIGHFPKRVISYS